MSERTYNVHDVWKVTMHDKRVRRFIATSAAEAIAQAEDFARWNAEEDKEIVSFAASLVDEVVRLPGRVLTREEIE